MKLFAKLRNKMRTNLNNRGQGATEYILLLVVVVGLVIAFGPKIKSIIADKTKALGDDIGSVNKDM